VNTLLAQVAGNDAGAQRVTFAAELVVRDSSGTVTSVRRRSAALQKARKPGR
jgi:LacI family transcriptional regulator